MKLLLLFDTPEKNLFFAYFMTWIYTILVFFGMQPFLTFSEIETQSPMVSVIYIGLLAIGFTYFIYIFMITISKVQRFRSLIFPFLVISIPVWTIMILLGISAMFLWFVLPLIPLMLIAIPTAFFIGLFLDLKAAKKAKIIHDPSSYKEY